MNISEINFGSVDAKHDIEGKNPEEIEKFKKSFVKPPNIDLDDYFNFRKYYITGLKGTGKTALLRYLQIKAEEENISTGFMLFKSDFDNYEKEKFNSTFITDVGKNLPTYEDYEQAWRWYFYSTLVKSSASFTKFPFQKNTHWIEFSELLETFSENSNSGRTTLPKITSGKIELSKNPKIEISFENIDNKKMVNFSEICRIADEKFEKLTPSEHKMIFFVDELEFYGSKNRDAYLIRDLVVTIDKINGICRRFYFNLAFIAAIRSEVLHSTSSLGKEINKSLFDFGNDLIWHKFSKDKSNHPLAQIISRKINSSEETLGLPISPEPWATYFEGLFYNKNPRDFILDQTWYRPRDLIRLFGVIKKNGADYKKIRQQHYDEAKKEYSRQSWVEITEELSATFEREQIEGIRRVLSGFKREFRHHDFKQKMTELGDLYDEVCDLDNNHKPNNILKRLYDIGVIGNMITSADSTKKHPQYASRGGVVKLEEQFIIHPAIKPFLG